MPVIHLSVSCARSDAFSDFAPQAPFLDTPQWPTTSCIRVRAPRRGGRSRSVQSQRCIGTDAVRGPVNVCSRASTIRREAADTHAAVETVSVNIVLSMLTPRPSVSAVVHEFRTARRKLGKRRNSSWRHPRTSVANPRPYPLPVECGVPSKSKAAP
ncbi:hypothetical protein TcCL_NonESM09445 [Trypanosoma cruzi]|nr:hypothetical protein TcCL_NonESM09445 [Trypanosoma cruzi]